MLDSDVHNLWDKSHQPVIAGLEERGCVFGFSQWINELLSRVWELCDLHTGNASQSIRQTAPSVQALMAPKRCPSFGDRRTKRERERRNYRSYRDI
eukprot:s5268_g2.t1